MKAERNGRILVRSLTILLNSPYHVVRRPYPHPSLFTAPDPVMPQPGLPSYKEAHTVLKAKKVSWKFIGGKRYTPYSVTRPDHPPIRRHSADDVVVPKNFPPDPVVYGCKFQGVNHSSRSSIPVSHTEDQIQAKPLNVRHFQVEAKKIGQSNSACNTETSKHFISVYHYGSQMDEQTCRSLKKLLQGEEFMPFCLAWKVLCQIDIRDLCHNKVAMRYEDFFPSTPTLPPFEEAWKIIGQMTYSDLLKHQMDKSPKASVPIEPASDGPYDNLNKTNHNDDLPIDSKASKASVPGTLDSPLPKLRGFHYSGPRQTKHNDDLPIDSEASKASVPGTLDPPIPKSKGGYHSGPRQTNHNDDLPIDSEASKASVPGTLDPPIPKSKGVYHSGPRQINSNDNLQFGSQALTSTTPEVQGFHHRIYYRPSPRNHFPPLYAQFKHDIRKEPQYLDVVCNNFFLTGKLLPSHIEQSPNFDMPTPPPPPEIMVPFPKDKANRILATFEQLRRVLTPLLYLIFSCIYGVLSHVGSALADNIKTRISQAPSDSLLQLVISRIFVLWQIWDDTRRQTPLQLAFGLYLKLHSYLIPKERKKNVLPEILWNKEGD